MTGVLDIDRIEKELHDINQQRSEVRAISDRPL